MRETHRREAVREIPREKSHELAGFTQEELRLAAKGFGHDCIESDPRDLQCACIENRSKRTGPVYE